MKTYFSLRNLFSGNVFPWKTSTEPKEEEILTPKDMLLADIKKTMEALDIAYAGLDNATDPDLIDCYIYEVNATLKRYRFLIHQAESMEIVTPCYEEKYATIPVPTPLATTMLLEAE
ncbi:MAG: YaaL family protein [Lachnospiraceae bacterium]|nr:YaaL family protein [Lachnospiraceae bacterium]